MNDGFVLYVLYFHGASLRGDVMPAEFIKVHELNNTRDLGETVHAYGKTIRKGLLFRGAELYHASPEDIEWLQKHISLIIDLRTEIERKEKPDPTIETVANIH